MRTSPVKLFLIGIILTHFAGLGAGVIGGGEVQAQQLIRAHAGITLNKVFFSPSIAQNFVPGNHLGVDYSYVNERGSGVRIGLGWMHKGWDINVPDSSYARVYNQMELPFLSRFVLSAKPFQFYIEGGPSLSYTLSAAEYIEGIEREYTFQEEVDQRFSFGLRGELGVLRHWGKWVGNAGIGYHQDLTNFDRSPGVIYSLHQNIIFSVGMARVIED